MELLCIHSFLDHGHDFRLYTYDEIPNIPDRVDVCDGNEILNKDCVFWSKNSYANFSDWFRWKLLVEQGGWYVDMDTVCLNPFDFSDPVIFARERDDLTSNGVLKFPPGHTLAQKMLENCEHPNKVQPWDTAKSKTRKIKRKIQFFRNPMVLARWGELGGPSAMTQIVAHSDLTELGQPQHVFYPIPAYFADYFTNNLYHEMGMLRTIFQHSYALHFYNSMWFRNGWDKNAVYAENSPFEILKRRHLL